MRRPQPETVPTAQVRNQYERYPFPPLEIGALQEVRPCQADYAFAHYYQRGMFPAQQHPLILDAGCGTGFSTLKLAELNPTAQIVAVELSAASQEIARNRLKQAGHEERVTWIRGDLQERDLLRDYAGAFDYVHSSGVIHHIPHAARALKNMRNALKSNGMGYFMVYARHARHQIQQIQDILYMLWQDHEDWPAGVRCCRQFFEQLPATHELNQFYVRTRNKMKYMLGEIAADSDAFLVDTYLQRCEHLWDVDAWFDLLQAHHWHPGRWLDEASWDVGHYLKDLKHVLEGTDRPARARLRLAERLRPPHNFSLFVEGSHVEGVQKQPVSAPMEVLPETVCRHFLCFRIQQQRGRYFLNNQMGKQLVLSAEEVNLWQQLDGQATAQQLLDRLTSAEWDWPRLKKTLQLWLELYLIAPIGLSSPRQLTE